MMINHFVEIRMPSKLGSIVRKVSARNSLVISIPEDTIAYRFFDRISIESNCGTIWGDLENYSPWTYLGIEYTLDEIIEKFPEYDLLIDNMKDAGYTRMVKTHSNEWYPLKNGDLVVK